VEKADANKEVFSAIVRDNIKMFAPIAPHICNEAWNVPGFAKLVCDNRCSDCNKKHLEEVTIDLPIQINGKFGRALIGNA
jgi:leucyl-tRNA synthetase